MQGMTWLCVRWCGVSVGALLSMGCATDPIVGDWEGVETVSCLAGGTDRVELTARAGGRGRGKTCACDFDFDWSAQKDGVYEVDLDLELACLSVGRTFDCELDEEEEILDCGAFGSYARAD